MKSNEKGFSFIAILIIFLVILVVGVSGWLVYNRQKNQNVNTVLVNDNQTQLNDKTEEKQSQETLKLETTQYESSNQIKFEDWKSGRFKYTNLSYKLPPNWQDISDNTIFQDRDGKYEQVKIKAPDGFILSMSVNDLPRGYGGEQEYVVLDYKNIDSVRQWIITDNGNGKVNRIYVGSGLRAVGEKTLSIGNVGRDGLNIEISGMYDNEFDSLDAFNDKQAVKEAKLVFESLKF